MRIIDPLRRLRAFNIASQVFCKLPIDWRKLLMPWKKMLAYATGEIDEQLLARIE